jgi:transcriptional regulator of nitric oxide reductase
MPQFAYVVLSNPVSGREDEYNDWYSNQHLADVTAVEGFVSAQRFRLADMEAEGAPQQRYMAIYTMETDDPSAAVERLTALVQSGAIQMSEAFSMEDMAIHLYEAITPVVAANPKD